MFRAALGLALGALLTSVTGAGAHAFLERSDPRANSVVKAAPAVVRLWFTERIEPAYSTARVVDERGQRVDGEDVRVDETDPRVLGVSLRPLAAGLYRVIWRVLSVDSHVTSGEFAFRVGP
jgi:hypothetical protein